MQTASEDLLRHIFLFLHPLTLQECKLVCKRWYEIIIQKETAKWFFIQRYHCLPPEDITFWDQYFPLPGGEQYHEAMQCYRDALRRKDKVSCEYFKNICHTIPGRWSLIFKLYPGPITRQQLDFVQSFVEYNVTFNYFREYGVLVGLHGDLGFYQQELAKIPVYHATTFVRGFLEGLCLDGHPDFETILTREEIRFVLANCNDLKISFRQEHSGIPLMAEYLTPLQLLEAKIPISTWTTIVDEALQLGNLRQIIEHHECPSLSRFIMLHHAEYNHLLTSPRALLYHSRDQTHHNHTIRRKYYQQLILEGDWGIYDDFVTTMYPKKWIFDIDLARSILVGKRPKQCLLYKPMYQLIEDGNLRRIYEVLVRLDKLRVYHKDRFYKSCLHAAIRHGMKDLVDYFLLYLRSEPGIFPLPRPPKHKHPDMKMYVDHLNKMHP